MTVFRFTASTETHPARRPDALASAMIGSMAMHWYDSLHWTLSPHPWISMIT